MIRPELGRPRLLDEHTGTCQPVHGGIPQPPSPAACSSFLPKRSNGPLRLWCLHCGQHLDSHPTQQHPTIQHATDSTSLQYPSADPYDSVKPPPEPETFPLVPGPRDVGVRCVVFDFDKTLSAKHVGMFDVSTPNQVPERCFGGKHRARMLCAMLEALSAADVHTVILTKNSAHTVQKALSGAGMRVTGGVIGEEQFGMEVKKSVSLQSGVLEGLGLDAREVLFVDDELGNVEDVRSVLGCRCIHVDNMRKPFGQVGMGEQECGMVLASILKP